MIKMFNAIWKVVDFFSSIREAKEIKANPEKQPKSIRFGVHAIINSIAMLISSVFIGVILMVHLLEVPIIGLVLIIALGLSVLLLLTHTIKNWALQVYINKRPITWISLAVVILSIAASIAIVILMNGLVA